MFEYFPGNYVWNLGVVAALNSGGAIDEVDRACRPIRDLAAQGSDVGTAEFMQAWAPLPTSSNGRRSRLRRRATGVRQDRSTCVPRGTVPRPSACRAQRRPEPQCRSTSAALT